MSSDNTRASDRRLAGVVDVFANFRSSRGVTETGGDYNQECGSWISLRAPDDLPYVSINMHLGYLSH
jgi:hypothetical protein